MDIPFCIEYTWEKPSSVNTKKLKKIVIGSFCCLNASLVQIKFGK